ncbi:LPXTG cell wall anchor domain-containing protein [bacterium]|nr:LPXTG cell wall anchor domain-containing protein [bacterium]
MVVIMKKILIVLLVLSVFALPVMALEEAALLSGNKTYTLVTPASAAYPDDDSFKLTDGIKGELTDGNYYKSDAFIGFNQAAKDENGDFVIILDLGSDYNNIRTFSLNYLIETDVGIYAPQSYSVYIANEAEGTYTHVGSAVITGNKEAGAALTGSSEITAPENVSGQYIKFVIHHLEPFDNDGTTVTSGWTFIDEIGVYASTTVPQTGDNGMAVLIVIAIMSGSAWLGLKFKKRV